MTLIIPCLGAGAPKKGSGKSAKPAAPVNKQKEKDKQAKKEIRDYVSHFIILFFILTPIIMIICFIYL